MRVIFWDRCWVLHIPFVGMVELKSLHISQWITFPTQSCLPLYSICANNAVVSMVSTRPPTSTSSRSFKNLFVTGPKASITIGIFVTFMIHSFFNSIARSRSLSLFSHSFNFISVVCRDKKVDNFAGFLFFCCWLL